MIPGFESKFECHIKGQDESLTVLDYEYQAGLSQTYSCRVNIVSDKADLDYWSFVDQNATVVVNVQRSQAIQYINGLVTEFVQMGKVGDAYAYELLIEPHFVQMKNQEKTEVFLDKSIPDIIESIIKHAKIQHYRFDLTQSYQSRPFVCQFQETDHHFICRWLEHEGIYYYFEQGQDFETLVLTDRYTTHQDHQHFSTLYYHQDQITQTAQSADVVEVFTSKTTKVPQKLELKGYNYNNDTQTIKSQAQVSSHGAGVIEVHDENVMDEADAKRIAEIKAQALGCKEQIYMGQALASGVLPGFRFQLKNHFRQANNQAYLVYEIAQQGSQKQAALAYLGLHRHLEDQQSEEVVFLTDFKAIPGNVQFRAPEVTPIKRIDGIIPAILDAETSGEYAQLDNQGRYKIRLLHSDKPDGKASDWVRKLESYLGNQYGNHFPLHKNTEICLAFEYGNPDLPIIMGAMHNSSRKNVVTSKNQKVSVSKSASGNMIAMGDQKGQEYMHLYSPHGEVRHIYGHFGAASKDWATLKGGSKMTTARGDTQQAQQPQSQESEVLDHWSESGWTDTGYPPPPKKDDIVSWSYQDGPGQSFVTRSSKGADVGVSWSYTHGTTYSKQEGNANSTTIGDKYYVTKGASNSALCGSSASVSVSGKLYTIDAAKGIKKHLGVLSEGAGGKCSYDGWTTGFSFSHYLGFNTSITAVAGINASFSLFGGANIYSETGAVGFMLNNYRYLINQKAVYKEYDLTKEGFKDKEEESTNQAKQKAKATKDLAEAQAKIATLESNPLFSDAISVKQTQGGIAQHAEGGSLSLYGDEGIDLGSPMLDGGTANIKMNPQEVTTTVDETNKISVSSEGITLNSETSITLACGENAISITPDGVFIECGAGEFMITPEMSGISVGPTQIIATDSMLTSTAPMTSFEA